MSAATFGSKSPQVRPPDKGSFPLDHEGECKEFMVKYMACLRQNNMQNTECRQQSMEYLECRMRRNLMKREDWKKLGYGDLHQVTEQAQTQKDQQ